MVNTKNYTTFLHLSKLSLDYMPIHINKIGLCNANTNTLLKWASYSKPIPLLHLNTELKHFKQHVT
jgi:hypothetical protein